VEATQFGRYQLLGLLGHGGMGEVWRARDTATGRVVAVKLLPLHLAQDQEFEQRFRREARTAAALSEPHIVPIHDFGEIEGRLYVDMRLIEGRELTAVLAAEGWLEPARAVSIAEQVGAALDAAHKAGLVHRDVKPSNILLTDSDFAYLIDFGIARKADDTGMTQTGAAMGTLAYMAPERFNGRAEPQSDIYALGCVLHECLTGRKPFPGQDISELIAAHLNAPPPRPSIIRPGVPPAFDTVIATSMAKDSRQRYRTGLEIGDAANVALAAAGPPIVGGSGFHDLAPESGKKPSGHRRHLRVALIAAAVAIVIAAVVFTVVTQKMREDATSASASASAAAATSSAVVATSSIWRHQRQRAHEREAVEAARNACGSLATDSKDAIDKVNEFVAASNQGRNTGPSEGPAIDALNRSAADVETSTRGPLEQPLHEALNAFGDAARDVATAIREHAAYDIFNQRVNQLNDTKNEAVKRCQASG
jgi:eukaryotic-like serine/threonine-protein kinase